MTVTVTAVAVGLPREVDGPRDGERTETAIWKAPVEGPVVVEEENLAGDRQADLRVHGGPDKSVYVYGEEDLAWWAGQLGGIDPAVFGQNLTTRGYDLRDAVVGERWRIGDAEFEVRQPRVPCFKLGMRAGDPAMPRRFSAAGRPGVYLQVKRTGTLASGDTVTVLDRPADGITVGEIAEIYHHGRADAARLLEVPNLPVVWHDWARSRM